MQLSLTRMIAAVRLLIWNPCNLGTADHTRTKVGGRRIQIAQTRCAGRQLCECGPCGRSDALRWPRRVWAHRKARESRRGPDNRRRSAVCGAHRTVYVGDSESGAWRPVQNRTGRQDLRHGQCHRRFRAKPESHRRLLQRDDHRLRRWRESRSCSDRNTVIARPDPRRGRSHRTSASRQIAAGECPLSTQK